MSAERGVRVALRAWGSPRPRQGAGEPRQRLLPRRCEHHARAGRLRTGFVSGPLPLCPVPTAAFRPLRNHCRGAAPQGARTHPARVQCSPLQKADAAQRGGQTHTWAPPRAAWRGKRLSQPSRPRARPLGRRPRALPGALPGDRHCLGFRSWALRLQLCLCSKLLRGQAADQALTASTPHPRLGLGAEPPGLAPAFHYTLGGDVPSIAGQIQTREEPGAQ